MEIDIFKLTDGPTVSAFFPQKDSERSQMDKFTETKTMKEK